MENSLIQNISNLKNLPKDWVVFHFDKVIADVSGGNIKTQKNDFLKNGLIAVIDQGKELVAGYVNDEKAIVKTNIPHFVFGDHTRSLKYIDFPFAMGADGTKLLKIKSGVDAIEKYVYYFFQTLNIPETGYNRHFKYLKECIIPVPPLATQQKIVAILDKADELRQYNKQLTEKYDALTQSLFLDMFGDPVRNEKGWEKIDLVDVCSKITDGTHKTPVYLENGVTFLSAKNIKNFKLNCLQPKFISNVEHLELSRRCNVGYGDILITKSGSLGMAAIVEFEFEFSIFESLALIKYIRNQIVGTFLLYFLNTKSTQQQYKDITKGVGVKHLHLTDLRKLQIISPPIVLQNQFAERVQAIEAQKLQAQEALEKSEQLFQGLLQKAFTGELSTT